MRLGITIAFVGILIVILFWAVTVFSGSDRGLLITGPTYDQLGEGRTYQITWNAAGVDNVTVLAIGHRTSIPERDRGPFSIVIAKNAPAQAGSVSWKVPFIDDMNFKITAEGRNRDGKVVARDERTYTFRPAVLANRTEDGIYLDVRRETRQRLYVLKDNKLVRVYLSSGSRTNEYLPPSNHPEKPHDHYGVFKITDKHPVWHSKLFDVDMTWAMRYLNGHFIHGTSPSEYRKLGRAASSGCNRLEKSQAKELYDSTPIGTRVEIIVK